jgi:hypothetical protein
MKSGERCRTGRRLKSDPRSRAGGENLVDLVGIEPTTSPAGRGALSCGPGKRQLIPELSDATSSSLAAARAVALQPRYRTVLDKPESKVLVRELKSSVRVGVPTGESPVARRSRYRTFRCVRSEGRKRQAYRKDGGPGRDRTDDLFHAMEARSQLRHRPTLKSHSNRRPPRQGRGALPVAPQAHCLGDTTTSCPLRTTSIILAYPHGIVNAAHESKRRAGANLTDWGLRAFVKRLLAVYSSHYVQDQVPEPPGDFIERTFISEHGDNNNAGGCGTKQQSLSAAAFRHSMASRFP